VEIKVGRYPLKKGLEEGKAGIEEELDREGNGLDKKVEKHVILLQGLTRFDTQVDSS
jgi:hypothetical protein